MKKKILNKKKNKIIGVGPSDDCTCAICVFTKSHAPGDSYDVEKCPKYNLKKSQNDIKSGNQKNSEKSSRS